MSRLLVELVTFTSEEVSPYVPHIPCHVFAKRLIIEFGEVNVTLSRQMGTSVLMLERHYSKLTATMAADRLA